MLMGVELEIEEQDPVAMQAFRDNFGRVQTKAQAQAQAKTDSSSPSATFGSSGTLLSMYTHA